MTITKDTELATAVSEAGVLLQKIQDYCGRSKTDLAKVRFPRGYLRTADNHRGKLSFINNGNLKSNLAYCLSLAESITWLLNRTDIAATAKDMLIKLKLQIFLCGSLVDSITKDYLKNTRTPKRTYKIGTKSLKDLGVINQTLEYDLNWVWDERNKMQLFGLEEREYSNNYDNEYLKRARDSTNKLANVLKTKGRI